MRKAPSPLEACRDLAPLPTPPALAAKLLERGLAEEVSAAELGELLALDPALSARVLRAVNAADFGLRVEVSNLAHAATLLGASRLRALALGATIAEGVGKTGSGGLDLERLWRHSVATAAAARLLAPAGSVDPEEAYLAGLLHDLGLVVLARTAPAESSRLLAEAKDRPADALREAEREVLGADHDQALAALAEAWGFPETLRRALAPQAPAGGGSPVDPLSLVVRAADAVAWTSGFSPFDAAVPPETKAEERSLLARVPREELEKAVRGEVGRGEGLLRTSTEGAAGFAGTVASANASLARLAEELDEANRTLRALNATLLEVQRHLGERDPAEALLSEVVAVLGFDRAFLVAEEVSGTARLVRIVTASGRGAEAEGECFTTGDTGLVVGAKPTLVRANDGASGGGTALLEILRASELLLAPVPGTGSVRYALGADRTETNRALRERDVELLSLLGAEAALLLEHHRLVQTVQAMAITDVLTGVFNRRHLMEALATEIERAERTGRPLAIAMFDLDHFKRVNDTLGHAVGDRLLEGFAALLRENLRRGDVVGRYGGEEFVAVLPGADAERAALVGERLREAMATYARERGTLFGDLPVSVSVGVAAFAPGLEDHEGLLRRADAALYKAKEAGRDRVRVAAAPPGVDPPQDDREPT